ncbi:META domain-containing protein [Neisseria shayeganii]|uniref:DUF306 domain-containing protein n=1 Tax=Neisseria shayeganii 871 TaxID=1032488 RepID=G4CHM2_9NEIS|nr:META domain-containing protein [Neisseria shayeganii]EGY52687.1 hypothetical protein HMPREF9371_1111 [Neisseria shayeganii 871]
MKAIAIFAAAALLAACTQAHPDGAAAAPSSAANTQADGLNGNWRVSHINGKNLAVGQGTLWLDAAQGRYALNLGCNNLFGTFTLPKGGLVFGPAASTLKMCEPEAMQLDHDAAAVLAQTRGYRRQGQQLELIDASGKPVLAAVAE